MSNFLSSINRRKAIVIASTMTAFGICNAAQAEAYPHRTITMVVPFAPGAGTDLVARLIAEKLVKQIGQPVIVENRPGAAGLIGTNYVAKSPSDGYTLLFTPNSFSFANLISGGNAKSNYNPITSFKPVIEVCKTPMFLVTGEKNAANTFPKALSGAKKTPASFGSAGAGSITHLVGELVNEATGINLGHVPYKGTSQAIADVLGGHIAYAYGALSTIEPYLKSGKLKVLATTGSQRTNLAPEVPTIAELGYSKVDLMSWYGVFAPQGTSDEVITLLNQNINKILNMPDVVETMRKQGSTVVGGTPELLATATQSEVPMFQKMIKNLNLAEK